MPIYKCGLLPKKIDPSTLRLASFLSPTLPEPLPSCSWALPDLKLPMYGNDSVGDCAIAAPGHMIGLWTRQAWGEETLFTDQQVIAQYSAISGYDPETGANDDGCAMLDVVKAWKTTGMMGHKCLGYASVDYRQPKLMKLATGWFGGLLWGLRLPRTILTQNFPPVWDVVDPSLAGDSEPGSFGGHAVDPIGYDADGNWSLVTWGGIVTATAAFVKAYLDECYAVFAPDWMMPTFRSPSGLDTRGLFRSLGLIAHR